MDTKKILVVDDHDIALNGIEKAVLECRPGVQLALSKNCDHAFEQIKNSWSSNSGFDLLITDLSFDSLGYSVNIANGVELIKSINKHNIPIKIIIVTSSCETGEIALIIENCDPDAYILKSNISSKEIGMAMDAIENDMKFYSQEVHLKLRNRAMVEKDVDFTDLKILELLPKTETMDQMIGKVLKRDKTPYSKRTIEDRIQKLRENLNANNNIDLYVKAKELGLVK